MFFRRVNLTKCYFAPTFKRREKKYLRDSLIRVFYWRKKLMLQAIENNMMTRRENHKSIQKDGKPLCIWHSGNHQSFWVLDELCTKESWVQWSPGGIFQLSSFLLFVMFKTQAAVFYQVLKFECEVVYLLLVAVPRKFPPQLCCLRHQNNQFAISYKTSVAYGVFIKYL